MRRPSPETSRDHVLCRGELHDLWHVLHQTDAKDAQGRSLRGGEVWRMRWADVDLQTGWWTLPAASTKNADPHRVPLTEPVLDILQRRWQTRDDRYVFSNHRHTCVASRAKKAAATLCQATRGGLAFHFRAHDLRRTAASYLGEAGVDRFHIAHVLNHRSVTHSTVTAIYDRYRYDKEKRAALETWATVLLSIVGSPRRAARAASPTPADPDGAPPRRRPPRPPRAASGRVVRFTPRGPFGGGGPIGSRV